MSNKPIVKTICIIYTLCVLFSCIMSVPDSYNTWRSNFDCFIQRGRDLKLKNSHIDKYLSVNSLQECMRECDLTFINCKSFSYNNDPDDVLEANCLLSREDSTVLDIQDFRRDFEIDDDFSFFERSQNRLCDNARNDAESPIWKANDNGGDRADFYDTGKLMSGLTYGGVAYQHILVTEKHPEGTRQSNCYRLVKTGLRISNRYVKKTLRSRDRAQCEYECSKAREFTCRAFNYRYKAYSSSLYMENCELSSQDTQGVNINDRFVFYTDSDFDFYEKTDSGKDCDGSDYGREDNNWHGSNNHNSYYDDCFDLFGKERRLDLRLVKDNLSVRDLQECMDQCLKAKAFECKTLSFSYTAYGLANWYGSGNCYLSDRESRNLDRYDVVYDKSSDLYDSNGDRSCRGDGNDPYNQYGREAGDDTVSGHKCYRDSCRQDRYGRFYSCQIDESGGWDYCCRPGSYCIDPQGSRSEWCYVGTESTEQWRPCSIPVAGNFLARDFLLEGTPDISLLLEDPKTANNSMPKETPKKKTEVAKMSDIASSKKKETKKVKKN